MLSSYSNRAPPLEVVAIIGCAWFRIYAHSFVFSLYLIKNQCTTKGPDVEERKTTVFRCPTNLMHCEVPPLLFKHWKGSFACESPRLEEVSLAVLIYIELISMDISIVIIIMLIFCRISWLRLLWHLTQIHILSFLCRHLEISERLMFFGVKWRKECGPVS